MRTYVFNHSTFNENQIVVVAAESEKDAIVMANENKKGWKFTKEDVIHPTKRSILIETIE